MAASRHHGKATIIMLNLAYLSTTTKTANDFGMILTYANFCNLIHV